MQKQTKEEILKIAQEKGWDEALVIVMGGDPCESQKNAVKTACKNCDPLNPDDTCSDALDDLADCMTENY